MNFEKMIFIVFGILILFSFVTFVLYFLNYPYLRATPVKEGFWITIKGKVIPDQSAFQDYETNRESYLASRPLILVIYPATHPSNNLCNAKSLQQSAIDWKNDTFGEYSTAVKIYSPMNLIITTSCERCLSQNIDINSDELEYVADIHWNNTICYNKPYEILESSTQEIYMLERTIPNIQDNLNFENFDFSITQNINNDLRHANEFLLGAKEEINETLKLFKAVQSEWFMRNAQFKIRFYQIELCFNKTIDLLREFNDTLCYKPQSTFYDTFNDLNLTLQSHINNVNERYTARDYTDFKFLKNRVEYLYSSTSELSTRYVYCLDNYRDTKDNFEYQKTFCEDKRMKIEFFKKSYDILPIVLAFIIGVILGRWVHKGKTIFNLRRDVSYERKKS